MPDKPSHILERFPEMKLHLELLIEEDSDFLALCEDYDVCTKALRYWEQSKEPEAETRVKENRILVQGLEEEIVQALAGLEPQPLE